MIKLPFETVKTREVRLLKEELEKLQGQMAEASRFIKEVEKGNFGIGISEALGKSELGASFESLQKHLSKIAEEEQERNWTNIGLGKFSDILRNKLSLEPQKLADDILLNLVKYVNANQGAIFILEENQGKESYLEMVACYAYNRKKFLNQKILLGEGLAGQCALEKESIYLTEVPSDYINITSGLGDAPPRSILLSPLSINEKLFGVLELASFEAFPAFKIEFITRLSENIAASIKNVKDNERTLKLLNDSQEQSQQLLSQEEEMRQNLEEMQATQEEIVRKNNEIVKASLETDGILKGINSTMAMIEFTPEGNILEANTNFLNVMQYSLSEIKGKHHRMFVPLEIAGTEEYKTFWEKLASGHSITNTFKRINSQGEIVWLNAIYNPIMNEYGEVAKVVKFATDITKEQEMLAESKGIMNGINAAMAIIEFTPKGVVLNANENFLSLMNYSLEDIKGKHHRLFVPIEQANTADYEEFWQKLAAGNPVAEIFRRVNSQGKTVWLNAIYNPIFNANGEVIKIIKFATDITAEKKMSLIAQQ